MFLLGCMKVGQVSAAAVPSCTPITRLMLRVAVGDDAHDDDDFVKAPLPTFCVLAVQ